MGFLEKKTYMCLYVCSAYLGSFIYMSMATSQSFPSFSLPTYLMV